MGPWGESWSNVEAELELEEPIEMGGDASAFEDKGDRGALWPQWSTMSLWPHLLVAGVIRRPMATFLSQGSVP